jgi:hypothetical protein
MRREEGNNLKQVVMRNPKGRRPRGKPRQKWRQVKRDLERLGTIEEDAEDRDRWRDCVGAARYLLRCLWP